VIVIADVFVRVTPSVNDNVGVGVGGGVIVQLRVVERSDVCVWIGGMVPVERDDEIETRVLDTVLLWELVGVGPDCVPDSGFSGQRREGFNNDCV
jgi:hypothetical protein